MFKNGVTKLPPLLLTMLFFGCRPAANTSVSSAGSERRILTPAAFATTLQTIALDLGVGVVDSAARQIYRDNNLSVSYPAGTHLELSMGANSPLVASFFQKESAGTRHGIAVDLLGDKLHYRIPKLTYDPQKNSFKVETDPRGIGVSGLIMSKAMTWFFAPKVPEALKKGAINPSVETLTGLINNSQTLIKSWFGAPINGANPLATLSQLGVSVSLRIPETIMVRMGDAENTFERDSVINAVLETSGSLLAPKAERLTLQFTELSVRKKESNNLRSLVQVGWLESISIGHGGKTTVALKTLISQETIHLMVKDHSFILVPTKNPTVVQQMLQNVVQKTLPSFMPIIKRIDTALPSAKMMQSFGL